MNPDTGEFVDLQPPALDLLEEATRKQAEEEIERATEDWPKFRAGQQFELNGVMFQIWKVTSRDICLRPVDGSVPLKPSRQRKQL